MRTVWRRTRRSTDSAGAASVGPVAPLGYSPGVDIRMAVRHDGKHYQVDNRTHQTSGSRLVRRPSSVDLVNLRPMATVDQSRKCRTEFPFRSHSHRRWAGDCPGMAISARSMVVFRSGRAGRTAPHRIQCALHQRCAIRCGHRLPDRIAVRENRGVEASFRPLGTALARNCRRWVNKSPSAFGGLPHGATDRSQRSVLK